jgi:hypothetical protein
MRKSLINDVKTFFIFESIENQNYSPYGTKLGETLDKKALACVKKTTHFLANQMDLFHSNKDHNE